MLSNYLKIIWGVFEPQREHKLAIVSKIASFWSAVCRPVYRPVHRPAHRLHTGSVPVVLLGPAVMFV